MIGRIGRIRGIDRISGGTWAGRLGILGTHWSQDAHSDENDPDEMGLDEMGLDEMGSR